MPLWVPPRVSRELADNAARDRAEIQHAVSHLKGTLEHWNRELRQIDDRLEMAWFDENVSVPGVVPCRYHILRRNEPPAPMSIIPVVGPNDEYVEPDSGVFNMLLRQDMWSESAQADKRKRESLARAAADRERERDTEARRAEIVERIQAANRAFVSMNRDVPWSQNVSGRRGVRKAA